MARNEDNTMHDQTCPFCASILDPVEHYGRSETWHCGHCELNYDLPEEPEFNQDAYPVNTPYRERKTA